MLLRSEDILKSGVFVSFSGNCRKALTFYQTCFGGILNFETFEKEIPGFTESAVVTGSLISDRINIHGSDLVHNEGRKIGNHLSIFLPCKNATDRKVIIEKLVPHRTQYANHFQEQSLIEVIDDFDVRWVFAV